MDSAVEVAPTIPKIPIDNWLTDIYIRGPNIRYRAYRSA